MTDIRIFRKKVLVTFRIPGFGKIDPRYRSQIKVFNEEVT